MISATDILTIIGIGSTILTAIIFGLFGYLHSEILDFKKKKNLSGKVTRKELKAESNYFFWGSLDICFTTVIGLILLLSVVSVIGAEISLISIILIIIFAVIFVYLFTLTCLNYMQVRMVHKKLNN